VGASGGGKVEREGETGADGGTGGRLSSARAGRRTARRGWTGQRVQERGCRRGAGARGRRGDDAGAEGPREERETVSVKGGRVGGGRANSGASDSQRPRGPGIAMLVACGPHLHPRPLWAQEESRGDESRRRQTSGQGKPVGRSRSGTARATSVRRPLALLRSRAMCRLSAVPQEPNSGPPSMTSACGAARSRQRGSGQSPSEGEAGRASGPRAGHDLVVGPPPPTFPTVLPPTGADARRRNNCVGARL
jgi:hypothetical protein